MDFHDAPCAETRDMWHKHAKVQENSTTAHAPLGISGAVSQVPGQRMYGMHTKGVVLLSASEGHGCWKHPSRP